MDEELNIRTGDIITVEDSDGAVLRGPVRSYFMMRVLPGDPVEPRFPKIGDEVTYRGFRGRLTQIERVTNVGIS